MAARSTRAAVLRLGEADRDLPLAKGDGLGQHVRVLGSVGGVTCAAGPPLLSLVHVEIMEIHASISELGVGDSEPLGGEFRGVAPRANGVSIGHVGAVEG